MSTDEHSTEINSAARQAGSDDQIESIIARAERQADAIRREAERDAEHMRREADRDAEVVRRESVIAAKRLLDRLQALEFPLGELVVSIRDEVEHASRALGRGEHVDSHATPLPPGPERAPADRSAEGIAFQGAAVPGPAPDADLPTGEPPFQPIEREPATPYASDPEPFTAAGPEPFVASDPEPLKAAGPEGRGPGETGAKRWWHRRRGRQGPKPPKGLFVTSEGSCAVCSRTFMAGSDAELEASGWRVSGDVGLCPDCQADGWQLPEGARLPVRQSGR